MLGHFLMGVDSSPHTFESTEHDQREWMTVSSSLVHIGQLGLCTTDFLKRFIFVGSIS